MEFRGNFLLWIFIQLLWVSLQIFVIQILFTHTTNILGWSKFEVFFLTGLFRTIRGVFDYIVYANLINLPDAIDQGELDYSLTRPVNALFLLSVRRHEYSEFATILTGMGFVIYSWINLKLPVSFVFVGNLLMLLILGFLAFYSIILFFATLSFFFTRLSAMNSVYDVFNTILRYPVDIFSRHSPVLEIVALPLAVIATIPARILFSPVSPSLVLTEWLIVSAMVASVMYLWNAAIKRYSSASS